MLNLLKLTDQSFLLKTEKESVCEVYNFNRQNISNTKSLKYTYVEIHLIDKRFLFNLYWKFIERKEWIHFIYICVCNCILDLIYAKCYLND